MLCFTEIDVNTEHLQRPHTITVKLKLNFALFVNLRLISVVLVTTAYICAKTGFWFQEEGNKKQYEVYHFKSGFIQ